jgi:hypothetical protein
MGSKIRIELLDAKKPKVWREMWVPMAITFDQFHEILQACMGWQNYHLYSFQESLKSRYFHIMRPPFDDLPGIDASKITIESILWGYYNAYQMSLNMDVINQVDKLYYIYDFGDQWEHEISVIDYDLTPIKHAEITDGEGACPPEDCGGIHGYERMKKYLDGKMSKKEYYDWFTAINAEGFDIHHFDMEKHNKMLKKIGKAEK